MMYKIIKILAVLVLAVTSVNAQTITETFGSGTNQFSIDFMKVGNPGNDPKTGNYYNTSTSYSAGSVAYTYHLGKYEISRDQITKANEAGGLGLSLADMTLYGGNGANRPATGIDWYEAARFVNWLNTSTGNPAAYKFDGSGNFVIWNSADVGYQSSNPYRNRFARYWLPNRDEWYKGAYGSPEGNWYQYPTGSNSGPIPVSGGTESGTAVYGQPVNAGPADVMNAGGASAFGTIGQGGNIFEWSETANDGTNDVASESREVRSGNWYYGSINLVESVRRDNDPTFAGIGYGFRIASVPEPSSLSLLLAGGAVLMAGRRRNRG